jgi:uncharacterized membrane protein YoaK (UPF0700 family)
MKSANQRRQSNPAMPIPSRRRRRAAQSGTHPKAERVATQPAQSGERRVPRAERRSLEEPSSEPQALGSELFGAALLSAVAGYVDAAGFLALFGMFTAHVTGDLVAAGAVVAEHPHLGLVMRLAMIPVFMLSVAATALFARSIRQRGHRPLVALLALMTLGLAVFGATGVALHRFANGPDAWAVALTGATGVVAMGIQNTLMRDALSGLCPTTVMTGNLTQFTIDLVELVVSKPIGDGVRVARLRAATRKRLLKFGAPVSGFIAGALLGGWLTSVWGLSSIAIPALVVGALTMIAWRAHGARSSARA